MEGPTLELAFALPTTIRYPWPQQGQKGQPIITGVPIAPRRRVAGARWSPRYHLAGMPALVDERDLDAWLRWAPPGERAAYHLGASLSASRLDNEALDVLARAVLSRACTDVLGVTPAPCGHLRRLWRGSGDVEPVQRRMPGGMWLYLVARR